MCSGARQRKGLQMKTTKEQRQWLVENGNPFDFLSRQAKCMRTRGVDDERVSARVREVAEASTLSSAKSSLALVTNGYTRSKSALH